MSRPVALVTGGGRGIGAAISDRLAADGYDVLLTYNQSSKPAEMIVDEIRERGDDALAVKVNCADTGEVGLLGQHPWMERGIDVLVLNHGVYNRVQGHAMTLDDLTATMKTNFEGAVAVWKAVQPHLTAKARMVVVGSQLGTRGSPHGADYAASKAALSTWARSSRSPSVQRASVSTFSLPATSTRTSSRATARKSVNSGSRKFPFSVGSPEDMAATVSFLVGPDSAYITGAILHVNGGLYLP